jgi:hypothetical protein
MRLVAFSEKPLCLIDVLHLPTISSSPHDITQDKRGWLQDHSYSSGLAKTILVPGSPTTKLSGLGLERQVSPVCNSNKWQTDLSGGDPISEWLLEKLLDVTPIPYSLEHGIEIMHPLLDSDCLGYVSVFSTWYYTRQERMVARPFL